MGLLCAAGGRARLAASRTDISRQHAPVSRPDGAHPRRRRGEARPHRHRDHLGVRPSDAFRSRRGLSADDDQEAASQVDRLRAALVPRRRHQRQISQGSRRQHLERVGRRARRAWAGLRTAVALLADARRRRDRPDRRSGHADPAQSGFTAADRHRLESGRHRQDGAAAVPLPVPVLRRARAGSPASSISAPPTSSSACRSTSRPMRC